MPGSSIYQSVYVSSGIMNPSGGQYANKDQTVGWIAPSVNGLGEHLNNQPVGTYYYRMYFFLDVCQVASCNNYVKPPEIVFKHVGGDNVIDLITVNNTNYAVNFPYSPFIKNAVVPLSVGNLTIGINTITVRVENYHNWTGMEINGYLELNSIPGLKLSDQNGHSKTSFCLLEDVILDPGTNRTTSYKIDVFQGSQQVAADFGTGDLGHYNLSNLIKQNQSVAPGAVYTIVYEITTACGTLKDTLEFEYTCCDESNDPSFTVMVDQFGRLTAIPAGYGSHSWEIFSTPSVHAGPYTSVATFDNSLLEFQGLEGACFLVKHWLHSPCGESCDAQTICMGTCDLEECILPQPVISYDASTGLISWLPVPGASKYVVVVTINDPYCCPNDNENVASAGVTLQYETKATSYSVTTPPRPDWLQMRCYSYKVYAICPDGTPSVSSEIKCFAAPLNGRYGVTGLTQHLNDGEDERLFRVYPNPASSEVTIDYYGTELLMANLHLLNSTGNAVRNIYGKRISASEPLRIDIRGLTPGLYLINIQSENKVANLNLLIE